MTIEPDTKDWTWVLERPCDECGFVAASVTGSQIPQLARENARSWHTVLQRADVRERPDPGTWSPLEYAAHVRDVCRVMDARLQLMLAEDDPTFDDWDQDAAAVEGRYAELEPVTVAEELSAAAVTIADRFAALPGDAWDRSGLRSNGSTFSVLTLGRYFLHDVVHHLHDVRG